MDISWLVILAMYWEMTRSRAVGRKAARPSDLSGNERPQQTLLGWLRSQGLKGGVGVTPVERLQHDGSQGVGGHLRVQRLRATRAYSSLDTLARTTGNRVRYCSKRMALLNLLKLQGLLRDASEVTQTS